MTQPSRVQFGYRRHLDQDRPGADIAEHPVIVVGAGPVGLSLAIDLAQRGQSVVLLDDADRIGEGSRAICFSKRSLEFWDRLGIGQRMVDKGVVWSVGKIFHGEQLLYQFNLLPEQGHKQPDDIWRTDLQISRFADPAVEKLPENVRPRIARMLGHDKFDFEWISLYKFQCRRMNRFVHGRVIFAGDAAHQVSPFGARGANSGLEDAENLAWKLNRVLRGTSPEALLESYHTERSAAADENIRESTRSTDFMAPNSHQEARLRKAVLSLARETEFGKRMINAGRLSVPSIYDSPLSSADCDAWRGGPPPGASMLDGPIAGPGGTSTYLTDAV